MKQERLISEIDIAAEREYRALRSVGRYSKQRRVTRQSKLTQDELWKQLLKGELQ